MNLVVALLLVTQGGAPLRKSDLVRLLSGSAMSSLELAQLVGHHCLTFEPTDRDRSDFRRLGADRALLDAVDRCTRRPAVPPVATRPARPVVSALRSGFVAGGGQRGSAGSQLPRALVFDARDSLGAPIGGVPIVFTGINARIAPDTALTTAAGAARVGVSLGPHAGSATVLAVTGDVEKQVAFNVAPGPAAQLAIQCGEKSVTGHFTIRPDTVIVLRVAALDGFANTTALLELRGAVADARIFRVLRVTQDSLAGTIALRADQAGTTSLAVIANGLRQYLTITVPPRVAPGKVDCP